MTQELTLLVLSGYNTDITPLQSVSPRIKVVDGRWKFLPEYRRSYPAFWAARALPPATEDEQREDRDPEFAARQQAERDRLLAEADLTVSFAMAVFPPDLPRRAPRLRWLHAASAGSDRLREGQGRVLEGDFLITTGRGYVTPRAIAEYVLAGIFYFAKSFPQAHRDRTAGAFDYRAYRSQLVSGKTIGIIGLGGIGSEVAALARGAGMRVVATRRSIDRPLHGAEAAPHGVEELLPAHQLHRLLEQSDYIALCALSTPDTHHLLGPKEFGSAKPGAYLINVARGEMVDETALKDALRSGRMAGALLDVYQDELERPPDPELWGMPNVLLTPHASGRSDQPNILPVEFYCRQLERFLQGEEMENVVDRERGY